VKKCGLKDFGLNDLKGKAATDMYRAGVPLEQIQHLLGHSSIKTTEIYIKARLPDLVDPSHERQQDVAQRPPPLGERIGVTYRTLLVGGARDNPRILETLLAIGENVRRDSSGRIQQLAIRTLAEEHAPGS
jgi:hypothetical protein